MNDSKDIQPFVKAMRRALLREHKLDVPYTALRAAYLSASGRSPHAQSKRPASKGVAPELNPSEYHVNLPDDWVVKKLYLAEDEIGCLERLSLDPDGSLVIKDDWQFQGQVLLLDTKVPRVSRYGMPDFLLNPVQFFSARFSGMDVKLDNRVYIEDLGDDSGGSCMLLVGMPQAEWDSLLVRGIEGEDTLFAATAEWAGLHYKVSLDGLPLSKAAEYCDGYLARALVDDDADAQMEWVWPDEDGDSRSCWVDLQTGLLTVFGAPVPEGAEQLERVRLCLFGDYVFDVVPVPTEKGVLWRLSTSALREVKTQALLG